MLEFRQAVFDVIDKIAASSSMTGLWDAYLGAAHAVGLKYGICIIPQDNFRSFEVVAEALPRGCFEGYVDNGLLAGDLILERARTSIQSFDWKLSDWDVTAMSPMQRRWREHCLLYGLLGGECIMDFRPGRPMTLIICGADGPMHAHDRKALIFAGHELIQRLREIIVSDAPIVALSRRERECLQWAAEGKTDWEIGSILSLSEKTVNVYLARAKLKLGAETKAKAIALAIKNRIIAA